MSMEKNKGPSEEFTFVTRYLEHSLIHTLIHANLKIIENRKLGELLSKGPSYRKQNNIYWDTNLKIIIIVKKAVRNYHYNRHKRT